MTRQLPDDSTGPTGGHSTAGVSALSKSSGAGHGDCVGHHSFYRGNRPKKSEKQRLGRGRVADATAEDRKKSAIAWTVTTSVKQAMFVLILASKRICWKARGFLAQGNGEAAVHAAWVTEERQTGMDIGICIDMCTDMHRGMCNDICVRTCVMACVSMRIIACELTCVPTCVRSLCVMQVHRHVYGACV